jgi:hypothetical protein
MSEVDPWEKAAECQRAVQAAIDPQQQTILTHLRNLWIALGNERDSMSADDLANEVEAIGRLHVELINSQQRILH